MREGGGGVAGNIEWVGKVGVIRSGNGWDDRTVCVGLKKTRDNGRDGEGGGGGIRGGGVPRDHQVAIDR